MKVFNVKIRSVKFIEEKVQDVRIADFDKSTTLSLVKSKLQQLSLIMDDYSNVNYTYEDGYLCVQGIARETDPNAPLMTALDFGG
ncbi:hypothetical protein [Pedobacter aquatilis]|uniref:hypothetical protein n=1 Tax=Pedobacter aquatilis TaxID=351343 RepID=UPI00292DAD9B|nr:hypothetical protein [Pedobacter aquatilis]